MVSATNELALEAAIERALTGTNPQTSRSGEDVKQTPAEYDVANNGFEIGLPADFNIQYAIDEKLFWRFLEQTQAPQLERLKRIARLIGRESSWIALID